MSTTKLRGIVLKTTQQGENNRHILVLAEGYGRIRISVRGGHSPKSPFFAAIQPFAYSEFIVFAGKGFFSLTQANRIAGFSGLTDSLDALYYALYCLDLAEKNTWPGEAADSLLHTLLHTLHVISAHTCDPSLAATVLEWKLLQLSGFMPELSACIHCHAPITYVSVAQGGGVCTRHQDTSALLCGKAAASALCYLFSQTGTRLFKFRVSDSVQKELSDLACAFLQNHMQMDLKLRTLAESMRPLH